MWAREITNFTALREYPQNFVQFLESFEDDHSISIAMEYFQYGDLKRYLINPWTETNAKITTTQLLEGLIIMHNLGITHRDLRPENILVASLSPILVKIGDFGISKRVQNNDTGLRTSCGAMEYTAPEIYIQGHPEYTNAVDIWSLGCVVHRILTGHAPFTGPALWNYALGPAEFPTEQLMERFVSVSGVEFIKSLMRKDAGSRLSAEQARKAAWLNVVEEMQETVSAVEEIQETVPVVEEIQEMVPVVEEIQEMVPVVEETQETVQ
ncbi:kinase-like protein [Wilcoxina mikolae CBS 423.85]|nr:kinase-like protein [Wilcoxina mikolae CBS 423.85]